MYLYSAKNTYSKGASFQQNYLERKTWDNRPTEVCSTNYSLFMRPANVAAVAGRISKLREENGSRNSKSVAQEMSRWATRQNINIEYSPAASMDMSSLIGILNNDFVRECKDLYRGNDMNVFRATGTTLEYDERGFPRLVKKRYRDFNHLDMQNMDVWQPTAIGITNRHQRYGNKPSLFQKAMHVRNIDRSPEAFNVNLADRDALSQSTRGYDMSRILKGNYYS